MERLSHSQVSPDENGPLSLAALRDKSASSLTAEAGGGGSTMEAQSGGGSAEDSGGKEVEKNATESQEKEGQPEAKANVMPNPIR